LKCPRCIVRLARGDIHQDVDGTAEKVGATEMPWLVRLAFANRPYPRSDTVFAARIMVDQSD